MVPRGDAELVLRHHEDVVPQPRLEVAFELRQVEVRAAAARDQFLRVVEEVQPEVEDAAGHRLAVDLHVLLRQVPAARTHEQRGQLVLQRVGLALRRDEIDAAADRVAQVDVALDVVVPARRVRVLEVGHEHLRARVERVDDHLAIDRPGDLDAAIGDVGAIRARRSSRLRARRASPGRKSGSLPASNSAWRCARRASSSSRRPPKARCSFATKAMASGVRICANSGVMRAGDFDAGTVNGGAHRVP